jgi:hypothetical protein
MGCFCDHVHSSCCSIIGWLEDFVRICCSSVWKGMAKRMGECCFCILFTVLFIVLFQFILYASTGLRLELPAVDCPDGFIALSTKCIKNDTVIINPP